MSLSERVSLVSLSLRYGTVSWNVASALKGAVPPVFLHFVSDKPWAAPIDTDTDRGTGTGTGTGSAAGSSAAGSSASGSSAGVRCAGVRNWSDFGLWDAVAAEVVAALQRAGGEEAEAGRRLFGGWERRRQLPVEENNG